MIALVLTGVVSLIAYASIQAAIDSSDRLARQRESVEAEALMRTLLSDALRHPADPTDGGAAFELVSKRGNGGDEIRFVSRGFGGSLGVGRLWRVSLKPGRNGVELDATTLDGKPVSLNARIPDVESIEVRVVRATDDRVWQDHWESTQQFPSAVEIAFLDAAGRSGASLIVQTGSGVH